MTMSGECEINMTSWEVAINELYQLYNACKKRESQAVSKIVQQLKKRNVKFKLIIGKGTTTLHLMCFHGNLGMVKLLVEMYGNAEAKDKNLRTPLHLACLQSHYQIVQYLTYEQRCNLHHTDKNGRAPCELADFHYVIGQLYQLYTAYKKRDRQLVSESKSLLCGMNVIFVLNNINCTTILHMMCELGNLDMAKSLIAMYGNIEARDKRRRTPLHIACANGHINIVEYLISQCGCDIEARDQKQCTPLFLACLNGQTHTVHYLVTNFRCKFDVRDDQGCTPLHAASTTGHLKVVQYLISYCGCSPEVRDYEMQRTPLHLACLNNHLDIVKYLTRECRCNTEARDKSNCTALYLASTSLGQSVLPTSSECYVTNDIVSYLLFEQGCDPEAQALDGTSPMFFFYSIGELNMIKYCITLKKHDPRTRKYRLYLTQPLILGRSMLQLNSTMSPLHVVCHKGNMDLVKFLVEECGADPMEQSEEVISKKMNIDDYGEFISLQCSIPLQIPCKFGRLDILQYLISKCGPAVSYHYHDLMIIACKYGHSEIMKYLLKFNTPQTIDEYGLLHFTVSVRETGSYEIVKLLIAKGCNLDLRNHIGETALHIVCKNNYCPNIVKLLLSSGCNSQISNFAGKTPLWVTQNSDVFKIFMQYSPTDVCERILSDDIDEEQSLKLLEYLVQQHKWNPIEKTKDGDTPLHLACKADRFIIIKYLFSTDVFKYDPYAKNKSNQTPIELTSSIEIIKELIKQGSNPIDVITNLIMDEEQVLHLVKEIDKGQLNGTTANDNNALHLACLTDRITVVKYLLKESKIDVNALNKSEISPIQLTRNSEIIKELIRYGANPTDLYSYCRRILGESKLLQTTVKVFVLGDSNAGKSTLISSLKKEGWFNCFASQSSPATTVTDDAGSGHGIIAHDFNSKQCGQMTLYDFVGTRLFHESQSHLLHETACSPHVFLVVTNLSGSDEEIILNLQYWLGFLEEISLSESEFKTPTVVIGSNIDKCRNEETKKAKIIKQVLQERVNDLPSVDYRDFIALDCRNCSSPDITRLRRCLAKLCIIARNPNSLAFNAHCFQVYIVDRFKERVVVSVHEVLTKIREEEKDVDENDPLNFFPQNDFQLQNLCIELHNKSQILYLRDSTASKIDFENSWIIVDKAALASQLVEAFESKVFNRVPSNKGILSFSTLSNLGPFKVYNTDMFARFLCHLEYCKEISDQETLQAIMNSASARIPSERCFFFPALVENSAPEGTWDDHSSSFSYHCGWILQCTKPEQFFTSNFLQTLILRVMFCNTNLGPSGASIPALLKCSLWKGGISWGNIFGAESLVEVLPDNKAVIFLMRCRDANLAKCMEHRSTIIHQIRECAKEFCGNLKTSESFIFPTDYPVLSTLSISIAGLFDINTLAFAIANFNAESIEQLHAISLTGKTTPIRDLLKFEPYCELSALIIQEICNSNNPRYISCLTDDFLLHFSQQIRKNPAFIEITTRILYDYGMMDSSVDNILSKLMEWRDTCHITYQQLHKCIDRFSIFAGLNIVDMVPGLASEEFSTPPSSPVLAIRTAWKTKVPTSDSMNSKTAIDSSNNLVHGMQLGEY